MIDRLTESETETDALAAEVVARFVTPRLSSGLVVALEGELGAGKTRFVRGVVRALSGDVRQVTSPTFVLLNVYTAPPWTLYHLDAYRVRGADDLEAIGFSELIGPGHLVLVEWASRVTTLLPENTLHVSLEAGDTPTQRRIRVTRTPHGPAA